MKLNATAELPGTLGTAEPRDGELRLDDFLPYRLSVLANTISADLARRYASRFGVTPPQWLVMAVLGAEREASAAEIVARSRMDKVSVSRAVSGLRGAGHVRRRTDPADRRRSILSLSRGGREVYRQIVPHARDYQAALLGSLDPAEREVLGDLLGRLDEIALTLAASDPEDAA